MNSALKEQKSKYNHPFTPKYVKRATKIVSATYKGYDNALRAGTRNVWKTKGGYKKEIEEELPATQKDYDNALRAGTRNVSRVYDTQEEKNYWMDFLARGYDYALKKYLESKSADPKSGQK